MADNQKPRGIRNNNPGNIRWGDPWLGLVLSAQRTDKDFCQFTDPKYGIRAMAVILLGYTKKKGTPGVGNDGLDTVREIISCWAPATENDTGSYIRSVATAMNVKPSQPLNLKDLTQMRELIKAIISHENGQLPYPNSLIEAGVNLAYSR